jgi:RNA recognition motif-containing protein
MSNCETQYTDSQLSFCQNFVLSNKKKEIFSYCSTDIKNNNIKLYTLYIGDLTENVREVDIYEIFSKYANIHSLKICCDLITGKSLGYGYINFENIIDAEIVLEKLNFYYDENFFCHPLRLMWKNENNFLRKSGYGNLFVKNIPSLFNSKSLFSTFSIFGKVSSCKIIFDRNGKSMNYGFVQFENYLNSTKALKKLNGFCIQNQKLFVTIFLTHNKRVKLGEVNKKFTNIYIKNINLEFCNEAYIRKIFEKFGKITSIFIPHERGIPKGFAFVNFKNYIDAKITIKTMNNKKIGNSVLYVGKAEMKKERKKILEKIFSDEKLGVTRKIFQNNIIIKNNGEIFSEIHLIHFFSKYGKINNFKILKNKKNLSKELIIVNFENYKSISNLLTKIKPIYYKEKTLIEYSEILNLLYTKPKLTDYIVKKDGIYKNFYFTKTILLNQFFETYINNKKLNKIILIRALNFLSIKNKRLLVSELLYTWFQSKNKAHSKKKISIILALNSEKLILLLLSENDFSKITEINSLKV